MADGSAHGLRVLEDVTDDKSNVLNDSENMTYDQ